MPPRFHNPTLKTIKFLGIEDQLFDILKSEALEHKTIGKSDVDRYISETLEHRTKDFDILNCCKVNSPWFPFLSQIGRIVWLLQYPVLLSLHLALKGVLKIHLGAL